ncbi:MAG: ATP-dependent sacrificial sulfur transferase LarE [Thermoanaerobaculaceae bacterium]|nr:ATP-dependent sacrificial sulfur transferase LarE [Thermoanaerobaculaceae bacterium]
MATHDRLVAHLEPLGSALVAYSGGADSALVAWAAHAALGGRALAVTARSESLAPGEADAAAALAARIGIAHEEIAYSELAVPGYAANPPDRCYLCKGELFRRLAALARDRGLAAVLDGSNADDGTDYRPGRRAVAELAVRSPLAELGIGKAAVREALRALDLPVWDKPSSPCLSSRVPYGEPITRAKLEQIGRAEAALAALGFREVRVRHHGSTARIELPKREMARVFADGLADEVVRAVRAAGFAFVALDLEGLRSGSLNRLLPSL